ncbi:hypothetical protein Mapa_005924 [Marchantia paleacea]|nr:hypothetical protein Mapa_005924 [Marchantia paleacea]
MAQPHIAPVMAASGYAVPEPSRPIPPRKMTASTPSQMTTLKGMRNSAYLPLVFCSWLYRSTVSTVTLISFFSHLAFQVSPLIMEIAMTVMRALPQLGQELPPIASPCDPKLS